MGTTAKTPSKWTPIKNGRGVVTGYIEMFWSKGCGWVTIPGVSRFSTTEPTNDHSL